MYCASTTKDPDVAAFVVAYSAHCLVAICHRCLIHGLSSALDGGALASGVNCCRLCFSNVARKEFCFVFYVHLCTVAEFRPLFFWCEILSPACFHRFDWVNIKFSSDRRLTKDKIPEYSKSFRRIRNLEISNFVKESIDIEKTEIWVALFVVLFLLL